jgi:transmembrane sensor
MIQKLERIYNVVIINNNKDLKEKYFTATILYKEESINDVLSYLSQIYGLEYQIINNKILIE